MDSHRRTFLRSASAAMAWSASAGLSRLAAASSANNKITIGLIGCGGRGMHDADLFRKATNCELAYVCDADATRLATAARTFDLPADRAVSDLRRLLDDRSLDAVLITMPDHWHAIAGILACDAGKHAYIEKPISHNVREGRLLVNAAERNRVKIQHGTQSRSTSMMVEAIQQLRDGVIGDVYAVKSWNIQKRGTIGRGQDTAPPADLDYDSWVGPATMVPYRTNRVHKRWTWWYHFGTGDMGNDGVHDIDAARWALGVDTHPSTIVGLGGKYFHDDDQEFPDTQQVTFEYPGDGKPGSRRMLIYEQRLWSTNYPHNVDSGVECYGTKGQMFFSRRGKVQVLDDRNKPVPLAIQTRSQDDVSHVANFLDAIRTDAPLRADATIGHLSSSLCHLGNIATRLERALRFDPATESITGDEEAHQLLSRPYRNHWARPQES